MLNLHIQKQLVCIIIFTESHPVNEMFIINLIVVIHFTDVFFTLLLGKNI